MTAIHFGCIQQAICYALKKLKITRKKSVSYKEQDSNKVETYLQTIQSIDKDSLVYTDETSIDKYWFHQYAYAKRGKQVKERVFGKRYARTIIVAAQNGKNILAPYNCINICNITSSISRCCL